MGAPADRPFTGLLDAVSARTPAPGGGAAAAWACALAASLTEMCAAYADDTPSVLRARGMCERALELAEADLRAYGPVLEALRLPEDDPARDERVAAALSAAADSVLAIAALGAEVAVLAAELSETGNRHLEGDAATGALLAQASCQAAARLVELNLADFGGDPRLAEAARLASQAARAGSSVVRAADS
jgi:methenyltetrahydrofolate cyclohydrolase